MQIYLSGRHSDLSGKGSCRAHSLPFTDTPTHWQVQLPLYQVTLSCSGHLVSHQPSVQVSFYQERVVSAWDFVTLAYNVLEGCSRFISQTPREKPGCSKGWLRARWSCVVALAFLILYKQKCLSSFLASLPHVSPLDGRLPKAQGTHLWL